MFAYKYKTTMLAYKCALTRELFQMKIVIACMHAFKPLYCIKVTKISFFLVIED